MRLASRKDLSHGQIISELEAAGYSVLDLSRVGSGCPDLNIARNGVSALVEIKTPRGLKTALQRRLSSQVEFAKTWKGPLITAFSASEIMYDFNLLIKRREAYAL